MSECLKRCVVNSPSVIYNASLYHDGLLETKPEKYGGAADYDLYCRLADNKNFHLSGACMVRFSATDGTKIRPLGKSIKKALIMIR